MDTTLVNGLLEKKAKQNALMLWIKRHESEPSSLALQDLQSTKSDTAQQRDSDSNQREQTFKRAAQKLHENTRAPGGRRSKFLPPVFGTKFRSRVLEMDWGH